MRIAVIGTGNIGATVGRALARAGHEVRLGARTPDPAVAQGSGAAVTSVAEALAGAEAVLLAVPAAAVEEVLSAHAPALHGTLIVDATNRIGAPVANARAQVSAAVPDARYVRAFNTLGWENFAEPTFDGVPADLFFSSSEADRADAETIIAGVGLRPVYLGADAEAAVDAALPLWLALMRAQGTRHIALRVLRH